MLSTPADLLSGLEIELDELRRLLADVDDRGWELATRLPGWSVKDNVSHVVGMALLLLGRPAPEVELPVTATHIRNDAGRWMEFAVQARRDRPGGEVAAELAQVGRELCEELARRTDESWSDTIEGPFGSTPRLADMVSIVVFDWWCHEQDLREALARPGHVAGPVATHARDRILGGLQRLLPQRVDVDRRVLLTIDVSGDEPGRADVPLGEGDGDEALIVSADLVTWNSLFCGRGPLDALLGVVTVDGDRHLAERVLAACPSTP